MISPIERSGAHWVCKKCIGKSLTWEYTIGTLGPKICEVCDLPFSRHNVYCISHEQFTQIKKEAYADLAHKRYAHQASGIKGSA